MTRKEQIKEVAQNEMSKYPNFCITAPAFRMGAEWADAHPRWISVHDKLPKDGQHAATINKVGVQDVRHYSHGKWYSNFGNEYDDITHWMPLPAPPSSSKIPSNHEEGGEK